jgi:hypothetical protein
VGRNASGPVPWSVGIGSIGGEAKTTAKTAKQNILPKISIFANRCILPRRVTWKH